MQPTKNWSEHPHLLFIPLQYLGRSHRLPLRQQQLVNIKRLPDRIPALFFHVQAKRIVGTNLQRLQTIPRASPVEVQRTRRRADRQHKPIIRCHQRRIYLLLSRADRRLRHLVQHLHVRQRRHRRRSPVDRHAVLHKTRHHEREVIKPALRQQRLRTLVIVNRRNRLALGTLAGHIAARIHRMNDLMLLERLVLRILHNSGRQLARPKLLLHRTRRHLELAVNRINHPVRILRDANLGNVARGKPKIIANQIQVNAAGAKHHQVVIQLMHLLLEVRAVKRLVHLVNADLQPLIRSIIPLQRGIPIPHRKPWRTRAGQHPMQ